LLRKIDLCNIAYVLYNYDITITSDFNPNGI